MAIYKVMPGFVKERNNTVEFDCYTLLRQRPETYYNFITSIVAVYRIVSL